MGMLTKEDLRQIGELLDKKFDEKLPAFKVELVMEIGQVIEDNITPQFDRMYDRLDTMDRRLDRSDGKLNALINVLHAKRVITGDDKSAVMA